MITRVIARRTLRSLYTCTRNYQVTVLGGATDIGQTISLLVCGHPKVHKLIIHDTQLQTPGVLMDLSHVSAYPTVEGYEGEGTLERAMQHSDIVLVTGGVRTKPNTLFMKSIARAIANLKTMPFVGIVTEPLNVLVPLAASVIGNYGHYNPNKLFGITIVDVLRAQTFYAAEHNLRSWQVFVPVIGGHSATSIPLLSQAKPALSQTNETFAQSFTAKLRKADEEVIRAKNELSPVLSIAYSAYLFTCSLLVALDGKLAAVDALVANNDFGTEYFAGRVLVDHDGVKEMQRYANLSPYECKLLESSIKEIRSDVLKGKSIIESN